MKLVFDQEKDSLSEQTICPGNSQPAPVPSWYMCRPLESELNINAGKGGKGGGRLSNVLQDLFSNSSNSVVKHCGGVKANDIDNHNVYEYRFLQSCHFNCIF